MGLRSEHVHDYCKAVSQLAKCWLYYSGGGAVNVGYQRLVLRTFSLAGTTTFNCKGQINVICESNCIGQLGLWLQARG